MIINCNCINYNDCPDCIDCIDCINCNNCTGNTHFKIYFSELLIVSAECINCI